MVRQALDHRVWCIVRRDRKRRTRKRQVHKRCLLGRTLSPGYPDCRPAFFDAFQNVIDVGTEPETVVERKAQFVEWSKTMIAERGLGLGVPYELT